jgi:uncharacterized delta-60 repeat protein
MVARLGIAALLTATSAGVAAPPSGQLDPRFGRNGLVVERLTNGHDLARGLIPLPDGRLLVAVESGGRPQAFFGPDAALLRLRPDGTRDRTFGNEGVLRVRVGRGNDHVSGVARLTDRRLVGGGAAENLNADQHGDDVAMYAFRSLPSGRLDPTFGRGGVASVRVSTYTGITALSGIAVSRDGGVVVGANRTAEPKRLVLARFDARGRADPGFGKGGVVLHQLQFPTALSQQPDGRLLVVGMTGFPLRDWFVLRLRRNGTRDRTFGGDGLVVTSFGKSPDSAQAVAVDSRGRIVVAGTTRIADSSCSTLCSQLRLVRYLPNGRVDSSFGDAGRVEPEIGLAHDALGMAFQRNGGILVAGSSYLGSSPDQQLAIWRFLPDGRLDGAFGVDGVLESNPTSGRIKLDFLTSVAVQTDGRIVAAGGAAKPETGFDSTVKYDVAVLRAR